VIVGGGGAQAPATTKANSRRYGPRDSDGGVAGGSGYGDYDGEDGETTTTTTCSSSLDGDGGTRKEGTRSSRSFAAEEGGNLGCCKRGGGRGITSFFRRGGRGGWRYASRLSRAFACAFAFAQLAKSSFVAREPGRAHHEVGVAIDPIAAIADGRHGGSPVDWRVEHARRCRRRRAAIIVVGRRPRLFPLSAP
jgi:hypothetical protein